jgi:drug/metabolite transporter (DMT)-like permease
VRSAYALLFAINLVYATSYVVTRLTLDAIPPSLLAFLRLAIGAAILVPMARWAEPVAPRPGRGDTWRMVWMGVFGFAGAAAFGHWGLARSTASNGALLIIVEPVAIMLMGPLLLGERLTRREAAGAALSVLGAVIVVVNGIPGVTRALAPHWRGDLLLVLSGIGYASYSLIGRDVLARHSVTSVTARSILWGAVAMIPLVLVEWQAGSRPSLGAGAVAGILYLGLIITALGYLVWNWALARTGASRAAIFLTVQPIAGVLLGAALLHEPLTAYTLAGGALIVAGLCMTVTGRG